MEFLKDDRQTLKILETCGEKSVQLLLPQDQVVSEETSGFKGKALPFEDGAFDYVVSPDVYAGIEPAHREEYLSELRRIADRGVLVSDVFDSEEPQSVEQKAENSPLAVGSQTSNAPGRKHNNSLPNLERTREFFEKCGDRVEVVPDGSLLHWLAPAAPEARSESEDLSSEEAERSEDFGGENVHQSAKRTTYCTRLIVALKEKANVDFEKAFSSEEYRGAALNSDSLEAFTTGLSLGSRFESLEERIEQKDRQLARKEMQVRDLSRRLAQQVAAANTAEKLSHENANLARLNAQLQNQLDSVKTSRTWRILEIQKKVRTLLKSGLRGPLKRIGR